MKIKRFFSFFLALLFFVSSSGLWAQTPATGSSTYFDMSDFPLWAKNLRRGDIIAFGSFPFMYVVANFCHDSYRFFSHGMDDRYAPKPFNLAGTIEQTQEEKIGTIFIAAGGAVLLALIDYGIMRSKRKRLERESRNLQEETPTIIRTPMHGEEAPFSDLAFPENENP